MLRFLTAGESHGPCLTAILDGFPAGVVLDIEALNAQLVRRQLSYGSGGRMKIESDAIRFTGGFMNGTTTGSPLSIEITNKDFENWKDKTIEPMTVPRPGHADLTGSLKYGYRDLRLALERASARETACRVAVGSVCRQLLHHLGIRIFSYINAVGDYQVKIPEDSSHEELSKIADGNDLRLPDESQLEAARNVVSEAMKARDTVGGVFTVVAEGVPAGLGSHVQWDQRLDSILMGVLGSIQAIKGVEIGEAFNQALMRGSQVHDAITVDESGVLSRSSNRCGGFEGGITNGQPLVARLAMKPISTVMAGMPSVDLATGKVAPNVYERSDFCALPRAAIVGEAMTAFALARALLEKTGGDSLAQIENSFKQLPKVTLDNLPMNNEPWSFGYD